MQGQDRSEGAPDEVHREEDGQERHETGQGDHRAEASGRGGAAAPRRPLRLPVERDDEQQGVDHPQAEQAAARDRGDEPACFDRGVVPVVPVSEGGVPEPVDAECEGRQDQGQDVRAEQVAAVAVKVERLGAVVRVLDQEAAASELARVLAPGGRLVIEEPDIAHWGVKLTALGEKLLLMRSHFYTPSAIQRLFERIGNRVRIERQAHTAWVIVDKE